MHCRLRIISYLCGKLIKLLNITAMAEDLKKQQEELNDEQLNEVDGGGIDQALFINDGAISL